MDETDSTFAIAGGGFHFLATSLFASGIGPVSEALVPYQGRYGITVKDEAGDPMRYAYEDDWTVSEKLRYMHDYDLVESNMLPRPANIVYDKYGNAQYEYNEAGTAAIKSELYAGRAVVASFYADNSMPGDTLDDAAYINIYGENPTWAHYTDKLEFPNHEVVIVGWDDDYPKENFLAQPDAAAQNGGGVSPSAGGYAAASKSGAYKKLASVDKNFYTLQAGKKLMAKKTYYFKVRAVAKTGNKTRTGACGQALRLMIP